MDNNDYEALYSMYCFIKALSMTVVIFSTTLLVADLITNQFAFLKGLSCLFGITLGLFLYFYASDYYIDDDNMGA